MSTPPLSPVDRSNEALPEAPPALLSQLGSTLYAKATDFLSYGASWLPTMSSAPKNYTVVSIEPLEVQHNSFSEEEEAKASLEPALTESRAPSARIVTPTVARPSIDSWRKEVRQELSEQLTRIVDELPTLLTQKQMALLYLLVDSNAYCLSPMGIEVNLKMLEEITARESDQMILSLDLFTGLFSGRVATVVAALDRTIAIRRRQLIAAHKLRSLLTSYSTIDNSSVDRFTNCFRSITFSNHDLEEVSSSLGAANSATILALYHVAMGARGERRSSYQISLQSTLKKLFAAAHAREEQALSALCQGSSAVDATTKPLFAAWKALELSTGSLQLNLQSGDRI